MKKKLSVAALLAGLLSAGVVVPAHAAEPTDPAPTNVKISWKDETFQFVHVTWDEDVARPNVVYLRPVSYTTKKNIKYLPADAPNEIDLPAAAVRLAGYKLVVDVAVGTAAAGETSPATDSAEFDTIPAAAPTIESAAISGTSTVSVTWKPGISLYTDTTPGDPLDRDLQAIFQPMYSGPGATAVPIGPRTAGTSITFADPKPPYRFFVQARNEWPDPAYPTAGNSSSLAVGQIGMETSIPTWVVADQNTVINGKFFGPGGAPVTLQARNSATSPWYVVASRMVSGGTYQFAVATRGTRQYRVAVGNTGSKSQSDGLWFGGYSAPVTTTTQLKASVALGASSVRRGSQPVAAALTVTPALTGAAALQRWNGSAWVFITNVAISAGRGTGKLSAATAGTFTYRYYVPAHTFNGLGVAAAYSPNFALKVTP